MDWTTALTSAALVTPALAAIDFLWRSLVGERLKNAVRHEFDVKLEGLRAELRQKEAELAAVRDTALAALSSSHAALTSRRLKAVEDLWEATMAYAAATPIVKVVGRLKLEKIGKPDAKIQQLANVFDPLQKAFLEGGRDAPNARGTRPFVSPMAWALYTAYTSIVLQAHLQFHALKNGDDPLQFVDTARTLELVKTALPEYTALLDEHKEAAYPDLLSGIEEKLLAELRTTIEGRDWDQQSVERAARVTHLAEEIRNKTQQPAPYVAASVR